MFSGHRFLVFCVVFFGGEFPETNLRRKLSALSFSRQVLGELGEVRALVASHPGVHLPSATDGPGPGL